MINFIEIKPTLDEYIKFNLTKCQEIIMPRRYSARPNNIPKERSSINMDFIQPIDEYLNKQKESKELTFQEQLFKYIDDKNLSDSYVYNTAHIDRRIFSKIRSDVNYHPSKNTILLLSFALELTEKEMDNLLKLASYSLPFNNVHDIIIRYCIQNNIYNIIDINFILDKYNCDILPF